MNRLLTFVGRLVPMRLRVLPLGLCLAMAWGAVELIWRFRYGLASPAMGIIYVLLATLVGGALLGSKGSACEKLVAGSALVAASYAVFASNGHQRLFLPIVAMLAAVGLARIGPKRTLERKVRFSDILVGSALSLLVMRTTYFADRLSLSEPFPRGFAWIDTPHWLHLSYAAERGFPLQDPLFHGEVVNYHFGAFVLVAAVRALTGLPMHVAYAVVHVTFSFTICWLLAWSMPGWFGVVRGRGAQICAILVGVAWLEVLTLNLSSLVATGVAFWFLFEVSRAKAWSAAVRTILAAVALGVTKEVQFVHALVLAAFLAGPVALRGRSFKPIGAVGIGFFCAKIIQGLTLHPNERINLTVFWERLEPEALTAEARNSWAWLSLGILGALVLGGLRKRRVPLTPVLASLTCAVVGLLIHNAVLPATTPPREPISALWLRIDMGQFAFSARHILLVTLALSGLATWFRFAQPSLTSRAGLVLALGLNAVFALGRVPYQSAKRQHPEEQGDDPVVAALSRIEPRTSIVAADVLNWNGENPHWAAFFGHQFFVLRKGRWATAYPSFAAAWADQELLFSTSDPNVARGIVRKHGITHLIEDLRRPAKWLAAVAPTFQDSHFRMYDLR